MNLWQWMLTLMRWWPWALPRTVMARASRGLQRSNRCRWGIAVGLGTMLTASVAFGAGYDFPGRLSLAQSHGTAKLTARETQQPVVAAGFGYQAAGTSTILIRTYDPNSGTVLTEESYDLDVHEEGTPTSTPVRERIFAGGIGVGANGLSQFLLRVYDAATGKFLWQGQLNLNPGGQEGAASPVATVARLRATVMRVSNPEPSSVQPYFLLRARDPLSGALIWEDHFAAEGRGIARVERIVHGRGWTVIPTPGLRHTFDFTILAYSEMRGELMWQDAFDSLREVGKSVQQEDDQARVLPLWPRQEENSSSRELIQYGPLRESFLMTW